MYHDKKRFSGASQSTFYQSDCHQQPKHGTVSVQPYPEREKAKREF